MAVSPVPGTTASLLLTSATGGSIDMSSGLDDITFTRTVGTADVTNFGDGDINRIPTLKDMSLSGSGQWSSTHHEKLVALLGHSTGTSVSWSPASTASGNPLEKGSAHLTNLETGAAVDGRVELSFDLEGNGSVTSTSH